MSLSVKESSPAPPKLSPRTGQSKVFRAQYNYKAQQSDELSFDAGDTLYVFDMTDPNWWKARCGEKPGLIPATYVVEIAENSLHEAAKRGNIDVLTECISNNVPVNGLDGAHSTPLLWASRGGHVECMKLLMTVPNCDINVQNNLGDTALHAAAWKGHPEAVRLLLLKGANPLTKNNEKKTAFDMAKDPQSAALLQRALNPPRRNSTWW